MVLSFHPGVSGEGDSLPAKTLIERGFRELTIDPLKEPIPRHDFSSPDANHREILATEQAIRGSARDIKDLCDIFCAKREGESIKLFSMHY